MMYKITALERIIKHGPKTIELEDGTKLRMNKDARIINDPSISDDSSYFTTSHIVYGFNRNTDSPYLVTRTVDLTSLEILCITVMRIEFI